MLNGKKWSVAGVVMTGLMSGTAMFAQTTTCTTKWVNWTLPSGKTVLAEEKTCTTSPTVAINPETVPDTIQVPKADVPKYESPAPVVTLNTATTAKNIVAEHNRARMHPQTIANEIKAEWATAQNGAGETTRLAYTTAIASLTGQGSPNYSAPLHALTEDAELSKRALAWAEKLDAGNYPDPHVNVGERIAGYGQGGENIFVCHEATGVKAVRGFIVDDGENNRGRYGHRVTIYNPVYKYIGVGCSAKGRLVVLFGSTKPADLSTLKGTVTPTSNGFTFSVNSVDDVTLSYRVLGPDGFQYSAGTRPFSSTKGYTFSGGAMKPGSKAIFKVLPAGASGFDDPKATVLTEHKF